MKDKLNALSERISHIKAKIKNEGATKQAIILPFLDILGYDIFNPDEVVPEVLCDISNKGDRIDYIIYRNDKPTILIECKDWRQNLDTHVNQLRKYYVSSDARIAILTNGIRYLFFADHDKANIMDEKPFYSLDITALSEADVELLSGFRKECFNAMHMLSQSQDIKIRETILRNLKRELRHPSKAFVSLLTSDIHLGKMYESVYNKYSGIVKDCIGLVLGVENSEDDEVVKDIEKVEEKQYEYTKDEQKLIDKVLGWLKPYECEDFKIYVRRLAGGYIRFCYHNNWWVVCSIKIRPKFEDKLCVRISRDASSSNYDERYCANLENMDSFRTEIESQCEDTKSRFFKYRMEHNL